MGVIQLAGHLFGSGFNAQITVSLAIQSNPQRFKATPLAQGFSARKSKKRYPVCIKGKRVCPPEDVGSGAMMIL